jgi:hypothetical protein
MAAYQGLMKKITDEMWAIVGVCQLSVQDGR